MSETLASIITSVLTGGVNNHTTVSEEANAYATDFVAQGVLGSFTNTNGAAPSTGSYGVNQDSSADMGITVKGSGNTGSGQAIAYISGTPTSQDTQMLRARMASDTTGYPINANSSGSTKYDWIYLQFSPTNGANPDVAGDNAVAIYTSRSTSSSSDTGSPPTYGILLAVVTVVNGAGSITNANISDRRSQVTLNIGSSSNTNGWQTLNYPLSYSANNGGKEFVVTSANDLRGTLSVGMKIQFSRSVTPPTQCMAFASASSEYATKASPTGLSFTSAFTCEAWVYLDSYTGNNQEIISRRTSTSGAWGLIITSAGQLQVYYGDSSGNFTTPTSYQSIPLNQWVHVAGVVSSVSGKTGALYINGQIAPSFLNSSAASSLAQTGNLSIGCYGAGTAEFLNGQVSEARVWSVAQSQATIEANMTINLVGNETNLVALFEGNGNFNDATTNANNLTATGGAIATQVSNPYNAIEYGVITNISYSSPTTTLTLFTGNQNTIPNQTLNSPLYSTAHKPYGFPVHRGNWLMTWIYGENGQFFGSSMGKLPGSDIYINTGPWNVIAQIAWQATSVSGYIGISTSSSAFSVPGLSTRVDVSGLQLATTTIEAEINNSAQTDYLIAGVGGGGDLYVRGVADDINAFTIVKAYCGYI